MKIAWASLTSLEDTFNAYATNLSDHLDSASRPDTEFELIGSPRGIAGNYRSFKIQDEAAEIKDFIRLRHRDDVDGLAIGSSFDGGLREAREILSKPVLGYTETALLVSHMVGDRCAIIAGTDKFIPIFQENVRIYGLGEHVSGIYTPESENRYLEYLGDAFEDASARESLVDEFEKMTKTCADDGAEVVIPGGGALPTLLNHMEGVTEFHGVPVMDATAVLVQLTETMVDLYDGDAIRTSKKRTYRPPTEEFLAELEEVYEI